MVAQTVRFYIWPRYVLEVNGKRIVFTNKPGAALARLFRSFGEYVSTDEIIEAVYFHAENGGPLCANTCIKVSIYRVRKILAKAGLLIESQIGRTSMGYRLVNRR